MTDDNLREALQGIRQPQPGIVYIADVLAYVEPELERLDKVVKLLGAHLQGGAQDVKDVLGAMTEAEADRDRARDAAVALEQENARLTEEVERLRANAGSWHDAYPQPVSGTDEFRDALLESRGGAL